MPNNDFEVFGVDTSAFHVFQKQLTNLEDKYPNRFPVELPLEDLKLMEEVLNAYRAAFACLLDLLRAQMERCTRIEPQRRYTRHFLPAYEAAQRKAIEMIDREIVKVIENKPRNLIGFIIAIRDGQVGKELVGLDKTIREGKKTADPKDLLHITTTVADSFKEQIEIHTKRKSIATVFRTLNDVGLIIRGAN